MSSAPAAAATAVLVEAALGGLGERERREAAERIASRLRDDAPSDSTLSTAHLVAQIAQCYPDVRPAKALVA